MLPNYEDNTIDGLRDYVVKVSVYLKIKPKTNKRLLLNEIKQSNANIS